MSTTTAITSNLQSLAARIRRDIRSRGLGTGDRYLTSSEAGQLLDVSTATASRAMALLVGEQLLVRRRRSGTFVGARAGKRRTYKIHSIYVLAMEHQVQDMPRADLLIQGIRGSIPDANVHFAFLPEDDCLPYARDLLRVPTRGGELAGVVPISCGREVYRFLMDTGVPTVVSGSVYSSSDRLASVDVNNKEAARLLVGHLAARGHRRIAVISNTQGCPGDNYFTDGISEALTDAGLPPNSVLTRYFHDEESLVAQVRELLLMDDPITGLVARTLRIADVVTETASRLGRAPGEDLEIVFQDYTISPVEEAPFVHARTKVRFEQHARLIGQMLNRLGEDREWEPEHIVLPVELHYPKGG